MRKYKTIPLHKRKNYIDDVAFVRRLAAAQGEHHSNILVHHVTEQAKALERQVKNSAAVMSPGEKENAQKRLQHLAEIMAAELVPAPQSAPPRTPWRAGTTPLHLLPPTPRPRRAPPSRR
jgi:hypothetical protein